MNSQKPLTIGIIGSGNMGRHHQRVTTEYGASVVAIHDVQLEAARELATHTDGALATTDLDAFFDIEMDGVVITTPPPIRFEPIQMACDRGIPMMIEKPPALNMIEGRKCLEAIEKADVIAAVGFQLRYHPLYERLKALIAAETVHLVRTVCTVNYYLSFSMAPWFLQYEISGGPLAGTSSACLGLCAVCYGEPETRAGACIGYQKYGVGTDRVRCGKCHPDDLSVGQRCFRNTHEPLRDRKF